MSDLVEVEQLKYAYLRTLDLKRWDEFEQLLVPEVTGRYGGLDFESRDELVDYMRTQLTDDITTFHQVHHPEITVDGDRARGRWYLHDKVFVPAFDLALEGAAFYDDVLVRTAEGWRFSQVSYHRTFEATWTMSAVPGWKLRRGRRTTRSEAPASDRSPHPPQPSRSQTAQRTESAKKSATWLTPWMSSRAS